LPKSVQIPGVDLSTVCGVPDDCWIFDNGKDFSGKTIEGTMRDEEGRLRLLDRRMLQRALVDAAEEMGDSRLEPVVYGLMIETEAKVRRALPYNAKAKIVERTFRDISEGFDCICPGYVGNEPAKRTSHIDDARKKHAALWKAGHDRKDIAKATGFLLIEDYSARLQTWLWSVYSLRVSQAQGLEHDGRMWSALDLWNRLAPARRVPSEESLQRLSMVPADGMIRRGGTIQFEKRIYQAAELVAWSGQKATFLYSPLERGSIVVLGLAGEQPWAESLRVHEAARVAANGTHEEVTAAMRENGETRSEERRRVKALGAGEVPDVLGAMMQNQTNGKLERGSVVVEAGRAPVEIVSMAPPVKDTAATAGATSARRVGPEIEDGEPVFRSARERAEWEARQRRAEATG
ncbi:MAG TPA: hypothetical protein VK181_27180, partial [Rhizobium sp.]|nr:hypothetical protein [Rhizobium sp.]